MERTEAAHVSPVKPYGIRLCAECGPRSRESGALWDVIPIAQSGDDIFLSRVSCLNLFALRASGSGSRFPLVAIVLADRLRLRLQVYNHRRSGGRPGDSSSSRRSSPPDGQRKRVRIVLVKVVRDRPVRPRRFGFQALGSRLAASCAARRPRAIPQRARHARPAVCGNHTRSLGHS